MTIQKLLHKTGATFLLVLLAVAFTVTGHAQEFRATVSGAVTDPSGAVVGNASVTLRENQTGTVNHTVSDASGQYVIPFLLPGSYTLTVTGAGFETTTQSNITLQSQEHPIINVTLTLGATNETVTVTSATR